MTGRVSGRQLTREEEQLWRVVTEKVRPLKSRRRALPEDDASLPSDTPGRKPALSPAPKAVVTHRKPLESIDRRTKRSLLKGRIVIDGRLDLHGSTIAEAHRRVVGFLTHAQQEGARVILLVTGKGKGGADGHEWGPLRREAPMWLADPKLRHIVAAYGEASPAHGGAGALYVRLRGRVERS